MLQQLSRLRVQLLLLVLAAIIPVAALVLYSAREEGRHRTAEAQASALRVARGVAAQQNDQIVSTRSLLMAVAQLKAVRERDVAGCHDLLARLLTQTQGFTTLSAVDVDGSAFCSATPPAAAGTTVADRPYFQTAIRTGDFAIGEFTIGRASGRTVIPAAYPLLDDSGSVAGAVLTGIDLSWFGRLAAQAHLPSGSTLTIVDGSGTVLAGFPEGEARIGQNVAGTVNLQAMQAQREGTDELRGPDRVPRLFAYTALGDVAPNVFVRVGIPRASALGDVQAALLRNLTVLAGVTLLAAAVAWFAGDRFILRPIDALVHVADRLSSGDEHARAAVPHASRELRRLARAFNHMTETLDQRRARAEIAEENARANEVQLARVFETMVDGLIVFDAGGRFLRVNAAAERILGLSRDEMATLPHETPPWTRLTLDGAPFPEDEYPFAVVKRSGAPLRGVEFAIVRPDGSHSVLSVNAAPLFAGDDAFAGAVAVFADVSERKDAEERLRVTLAELEAQYREAEHARGMGRAILDAAGDPMLAVAPDGTILTANKRFALLFDTEAASLSERRLDELLPAVQGLFAEPEQSAALLSEALTEPERELTGTLVQEVPERREFALLSLPVRSDEQEHLGRLIVLHDVTREREVDRMKSEFVSLVSHELRTPLTSIKGYVDLLLDGEVGEVAAEQQEFLGIVKSNADRLVALINDLLDISRIEAGRVELHRAPLDLARLVAEIADSLRPQIAAKQQQLALDFPAGLPPVSADADRLLQIVLNLLSNAHKYTPAGGTIHITAAVVEGQVELSVADSGIGLSAEEQARLFTRFFRAKNRTTQEVGGTGLGLSIVRSLVELHGGQIRVESAPGQGSTFRVTLPAATVAVAPPAVAPLRPGGRVLVVDDEPDIARLIGRYLERAGYRVRLAHSAAAALQAANAEPPDLITLDVQLPDSDGFTVLEWLRGDPATAQIPVIMLSILPDHGIGRLLGAVDYLTKPVGEAALLERVGTILAGRPRSVLLVEDDADVRVLLSRHLRAAGYSVIEAADGVEALAAAAEQQPGLVLMDIRMPRMGGVEALRRLREAAATRETPVVMMTASPGAAEESRSAIETLGCATLLSKPCTAEELVAVIAAGASIAAAAPDGAGSGSAKEAAA